MRKDDDEHWTDDVDLDRVRATSGGISGGWTVVAAIAALMLIVPPAINATNEALVDAKQQIVRAEYRLAQVMPLFAVRTHRC
jgi:hypothetical protein